MARKPKQKPAVKKVVTPTPETVQSPPAVLPTVPDTPQMGVRPDSGKPPKPLRSPPKAEEIPEVVSRPDFEEPEEQVKAASAILLDALAAGAHNHPDQPFIAYSLIDDLEHQGVDRDAAFWAVHRAIESGIVEVDYKWLWTDSLCGPFIPVPQGTPVKIVEREPPEMSDYRTFCVRPTMKLWQERRIALLPESSKKINALAEVKKNVDTIADTNLESVRKAYYNLYVRRPDPRVEGSETEAEWLNGWTLRLAEFGFLVNQSKLSENVNTLHIGNGPADAFVVDLLKAAVFKDANRVLFLLKNTIIPDGFSPETSWWPVFNRDDLLKNIIGSKPVTKVSTPNTPSRKRRCHDRDHTWLTWYESDGESTYHSCAAIRDKWNQENRGNKINDGPNGCEVVKKGIARAKADRQPSPVK